MQSSEWYTIENIDTLDSPSLVIYPDRVSANIRTLIASVNDINRLRPHIKTHKSPEVSRMMLDMGIRKFKCATIAEAEMLATVGAPDVLLAYQPVGPKLYRLIELVKRFPKVIWGCLVDNTGSAKAIATAFEKAGLTIFVYIDLNVGMNRTGIVPEQALPIAEACTKLKGITLKGLHAYDGHLRDADYNVRSQRCDEAFERVKKLQHEVETKTGTRLTLVAGGSPTFSIHCKRTDVECSPGTFVYWDRGYEDTLKEQKFVPAALVVTRVVSLPTPDTVCVDLGHKAIASENPLNSRVFFLNAPGLQPIGHSEEHMVFTTTEKKYKVGDVFYGVPFHICPTIALHETANIVVDHEVRETWITTARKRKLTL